MRMNLKPCPFCGSSYIVLVVLILAAVGYLAVSLWNECRATFSFLYCLNQFSG